MNGKLTTPVRNHYFYGKMLDVAHFNMEQDYLNNKRWLINRLGLGAGVLCGLELSLTEDNQLMVSAGVAIDRYGREVIVPRGYCIENPRQITDDGGRPTDERIEETGTVTICLGYHECKTDYVPVMVTDCDTHEDREASSIQERFRLLVTAGTPDSAAGTVSDEQCTQITGDIAADAAVLRQRVIGALRGACIMPDGDCVVLGTVEFAEGGTTLDMVTYRQQTLSNATLLDLMMCLMTEAQTYSLRYVSGDAQTGSTGEMLSEPLVAEVLDKDGAPAADVPVVFRVRSGDGALEATSATSDANGRVEARWRLNTQAGLNTSEVMLERDACCTVVFHAMGEAENGGGTAELPHVAEIFPENATVLSREENRELFNLWAEIPRIELRFDSEMTPDQLEQPDEWLRVFQMSARGDEGIAVTRINLEQIDPLALDGDFVVGYRLQQVANEPEPGTGFLVLMRARNDNITSAAGRLLDADFAGSTLNPELFETIWSIRRRRGTLSASRDDIFTTDDDQLPSGDGSAGGDFSSWFIITE